MKLRFEPVTDKADIILESIMNAPEIPEDPGLQFKIRLCSEEAVVNVVNYAYEGGNGFLDIETEAAEGWFILKLKDAGTPFDPLSAPEPDITLAADEREIGGLGIFLCKQMMDEVHYAYEGGCNILTMKIKTNINDTIL